MLEKGLAPDFSPQELIELDKIHAPNQTLEKTRDLSDSYLFLL